MIDESEGAGKDLDALATADPKAYSAVIVFLEEAEADSALIDKFTTMGDVEIAGKTVNVKPWVAARSSGRNLFRIRLLDTPATGYRVVYGYNWKVRRIVLLAVVFKGTDTEADVGKEKFDYELSDELGERILADWSVATGGEPT